MAGANFRFVAAVATAACSGEGHEGFDVGRNAQRQPGARSRQWERASRAAVVYISAAISSTV